MANIVIIGGGGIAEGIKAVVGGEIVPQSECNICVKDDIEQAIYRRKPDVVINCAGVSNPSSIKDMKITDLWRELNVNLYGSIILANVCANAGVKTVIYIASVAGMHGKPNHAAYSASKSGVISLVQSLAEEGYDAYAISPGRVDTPMRQADFPDEDPRTRLKPELIGGIVKDILDNKYESGDNIAIRMKGFDILPIKVDKGAYREWLSFPKKHS